MSENAFPVSPAPSEESVPNDMRPDVILERARLRAKKQNLVYAGAVTPAEAWELVKEDRAIIVDVRTQEEYKFVGHVPDSLLIPWMCGTSMTKNPGFVSETEKQLSKEAIILLLCRSGKRSAGAAEALTAAGFTNVFNITEGFEGKLNDRMQRNHVNGWRFRHLPWLQE